MNAALLIDLAHDTVHRILAWLAVAVRQRVRPSVQILRCRQATLHRLAGRSRRDQALVGRIGRDQRAGREAQRRLLLAFVAHQIRLCRTNALLILLVRLVARI